MNELPGHTGPDLALGVRIADLHEGVPIRGHVVAEQVILVRAAGGIFAVDALCTHYHGPLAAGLVEADRIHCPLHHACFSLRTGEALQAPALDPLRCWRVEIRQGVAYVMERMARPAKPSSVGTGHVQSIVIVGAGAAGVAAADMLRRQGHTGHLTLLSAENNLPSDRPNLSKDYLDGSAPVDWVPLRSESFYSRRGIRLRLNEPVAGIDTVHRKLRLDSGEELGFDAMLLATGAQPVRLDIPGAGAPVLYLRSFADCEAILARVTGARAVVVVGTSFIGLEVAAALRQRGLAVHVVGRGAIPLEPVLGAELGRFVQSVHEAHGVVFHFGTTVQRIDGNRILLGDGTVLAADFLVLGVGVSPMTTLAEQAGLAMDGGVLVDQYLQTSASGIYAAGDIARWPDPHTGTRLRVEHWVVAERQGQVAARNMLGQQVPFDAVPFFWSQHYDLTINYVGHANYWDSIEMDGSLAARNCALSYRHNGRTLAVATIGRDMYSLQSEMWMQDMRGTTPAREAP